MAGEYVRYGNARLPTHSRVTVPSHSSTRVFPWTSDVQPRAPRARASNERMRRAPRGATSALRPLNSVYRKRMRRNRLKRKNQWRHTVDGRYMLRCSARLLPVAAARPRCAKRRMYCGHLQCSGVLVYHRDTWSSSSARATIAIGTHGCRRPHRDPPRAYVAWTLEILPADCRVCPSTPLRGVGRI